MKKVFRLIPSLDCTELEKVERIARAVGNEPGIYGFKVGFSLGLSFGLPRVVETIRRHSRKPVIYDHQKAGTDIPDTGKLFAQTMKNTGIDEVILFPQSGPETMKAWTAAVREQGLKVIVGGIMTHKAYLQSEGGFLSDAGVEGIYRIAVEEGVKAFVVPLTKAKLVRELIGSVKFGPDDEFYSPGFGAQGGDPGAFREIRRHYLICGRSILGASDPVEWVGKTLEELKRYE